MRVLDLVRNKARRRRVMMFGPASPTLPTSARVLIGNADFRQAFIEASDFVEARRGWSLWRELGNDAPPAGVTSSERNFVQEVVLQLSLFRAVQAAGVEYEVVAGISLGDAAAGYASGALTFEETLHVMCETIRAVLCAAGGDLIAVQASPERVSEITAEPAVRLIFDWSLLSVWAVPDEHALRMQRKLRVARIAYSRLGFNCLSHTDRVDIPGLQQALSTLPTRTPDRKLFSTLEGDLVEGSTPPARWVRAITEPVQLEGMWRAMRKGGYTDIIYIGSVPADKDLFGGLPRSEQPRSFTKAQSLISIGESASSINCSMREESDEGDIQTILRSSKFARDPYPYYRRWQDDGPVHKSANEDFVLVVGYDAAVEVLKHPAVFSSSPFESLSDVLPGADAPLHTRVRRGLSPFFSRDRIHEQEDRVSTMVRAALERMQQRRRFDGCNDFALPLTFAVWCEVLGLHQEQAATVAPMRAAEATWQNVEFSLNGSGILSEIIAKDELPHDDIARLLPFMIGAGTLTMRDTVCSSMMTLVRNPATLEALVGDRSLVPQFVEELLRYEPGIHGVPRRTLSETMLEGVVIPEGSTVWVSIAAANRDPAKFEMPDEFVMGRQGEKHISFGAGPHYCLGSHLGRMEAEIVIAALLDYLPALRPTSSPDFYFTDMRDTEQLYPFMRGMRSWELAFTS